MVNSSPAIDNVFHSLAHPARRQIVRRLARGDAVVGEVAAPLEMSAPAVTKHLKVLEGAGLIERRVAGREHHLSLIPGSLSEAVSWIHATERFWERSLDLLAERIEGGQ